MSYPLSTTEVTGSYCYILNEFTEGDANFTGNVDIVDLQTVINCIFGDYQVNPFNFTAADTYKDNRLNVQDVVCIANKLLDEEEPNEARRPFVQTKNDIPEAYLYAADGKLMISSSSPVSSFDISFVGNPDITFCLEELGYDVITKQQEGRTHVIAYTLSEQSIPSGETVLATYNGPAPDISAIAMASPEARPVVAVFTSDATSIESVRTSVSSPTTNYYSVNGTRRTSLTKGINIVKTVSPDGNVSTKVIYIK